jgi:asparagine synthase (glutamine-hydrolysing)
MCGIFGIWHHGQSFDAGALERATTAIRHRGPDDEGYLLVNTQTCATALCGGLDTNSEL